MPFPFVAIAGIASGAGKLLGKIGKKSPKIDTSKVQSILNGGETPQAKKGFLGLFTGKKKVAETQQAAIDAFQDQKAQAITFFNNFKKNKEEQINEANEKSSLWMWGAILAGVAFVGSLIWANTGGKK